MTVIAHQGGAGEHPPQSKEALVAAAELGAPVEFDLKSLKDGGWALAHDDDTSLMLEEGHGSVQSMTTSDWQASCIKGTQDSCGTPVTWSEAVEFLPDTAVLVPEIKDRRIKPSAVVSQIKNLGIAERTVVQTFDADVASYLGRHGIKTVLLSMHYNVSKIDWGQAAHDGVTYAGLDSRTSTEEAKKVRDNGLELWVWTVNDLETAQTWEKRGAKAIFTDHPHRMTDELTSAD